MTDQKQPHLNELRAATDAAWKVYAAAQEAYNQAVRAMENARLDAIAADIAAKAKRAGKTYDAASPRYRAAKKNFKADNNS